MLDVPKKGSIEWVRFASYYEDLLKTKEEELEEEFPEGHKDHEKNLRILEKLREEVPKLCKRFEGVQFAVRNLGRAEVQEYSMMLQKIQMEEYAELLKERKKAGKDVAPELYEAERATRITSAAGLQKVIELARESVRKFVDGAKGLSLAGEPLKESGEDPEKILEIVDFFAIHAPMVELILKSQGLSDVEVLS